MLEQKNNSDLTFYTATLDTIKKETIRGYTRYTTSQGNFTASLAISKKNPKCEFFVRYTIYHLCKSLGIAKPEKIKTYKKKELIEKNFPELCAIKRLLLYAYKKDNNIPLSIDRKAYLDVAIILL